MHDKTCACVCNLFTSNENKPFSNCEIKDETKKNKMWFQILAVMSGALVTFTTGQMMGWASPSLPVLMSASKTPLDHPITSSQASWLASLPMIGTLVAAPLVAVYANIFGRKKTILFSAIPIAVSWFLIYFSNSIEMLFAARFLCGLGESIGKLTLFMYVGEITESRIRGALGTILAVTLNVGILYEYVLGPFVSYQLLALLSGIIPIILFFTFLPMPETPYYLILRGRVEEARASLIRLRRNDDVDKELTEIKENVEKRISFKESFMILFSSKSNMYTLFIACMLFLSQELSGITPNIMYAENILSGGHGNISDELTLNSFAPCMLPILKTISTILTMFTVDKAGRRPLFMMSCITCSASMFSLSAYFYCKDQLSYDVTGFEWMPLTFMLCFNFMFIIGLGCLPYIIIGELFTTDIKALGICITTGVGTTSSATATKLFQIMSDSYGLFSSFALFGSSTLASFFFVFFFVPETKNKTLSEIQSNLKKF